jgi:hypothetical protein
MPHTTIDNCTDILDSRDIIERIAELESERDSFTATCVACDGAGERAAGHDGAPYDECAQCAGLGMVDAPAQWASENPDEAAELAALMALQDEAQGYAEDWRHGVTLVRDSYFPDYVQSLLVDCDVVPPNLPWYVVVDWDATADNMRRDYTEVDFGGVTYLVR